jgi:adenylate cyclase class IV
MLKQIEIEFRSCFDQNKFNELETFLQSNAEDLGQDNKNVFFYIFKDKLLKVVDEVSKKRGKIVLKNSKIGDGSDFEEIEIIIDKDSIEATNNIFSELSLDCQLIESYQKRNNYLYKGVEIALKYSNHWGFHIELEIVIDDIKLKKDAEKKIHAVAKELNIKLMNDVELEEFVNKLEKDYGKSQ